MSPRLTTRRSGCSAQRGDPAHAPIAIGWKEVDLLASLCLDEPFGAWHRPHRDARFRGTLAQERHHRTEAGVAVLHPDRTGIHQHEVGAAQDHGLVQPCGVVVEEGEGAVQASLDRIGQLVVTREAIHEQVVCVAAPIHCAKTITGR